MNNLNQTLSLNAPAHPQDVVASKLFLRAQGFYHPPEWGISQFPDRALFRAIKGYQKSQGLRVDGVMKPQGETETAIKDQVQKLQSSGRHGDTVLAHITPAEAALLHDVTDGGSINPNTGLLEFLHSDFFSSMSTSLSDSFSSFGDNISTNFPDTFGLDQSLDPSIVDGDLLKGRQIGGLGVFAVADAFGPFIIS